MCLQKLLSSVPRNGWRIEAPDHTKSRQVMSVILSTSSSVPRATRACGLRQFQVTSHDESWDLATITALTFAATATFILPPFTGHFLGLGLTGTADLCGSSSAFYACLGVPVAGRLPGLRKWREVRTSRGEMLVLWN